MKPELSHYLERRLEMKPVVRYTPSPHQRISAGQPALIFGVLNHPTGLLGRCVHTSTVVAVKGGGHFETENTYYVPVG